MNKKKSGKIYKLYFKSNPNVIYIGKTENSLQRRLTQHISSAKSNKKISPKLYNWIRKHINKDELIIELIFSDEYLNENLLNEIEIKTIQDYRNNINFIVKNTAKGGQGIKLGYKHPEEFGQKARERNLRDGRWRGEKNHFFGKTGALNPASKKTYQYSLCGDFIQEFESARLAGKSIGLKKETRLINRAMETKEISYGFQWRNYKVDKIEPKEYRGKTMSESDKVKAQEMYDNDFSVNSISKHLGIGRPQIMEKMGWQKDIKGQPSERSIRMASKSRIGKPSPLKGKPMNEETKEKISKSLKGKYVGKKHSKETKEKISKIHKGKKISEEVKNKISKTLKGRIITNETIKKRLITTSKGIYLVYKNEKLLGEFISPEEAARKLNINRVSMRRLADGGKGISTTGKYKDYKVKFIPKST